MAPTDKPTTALLGGCLLLAALVFCAYLPALHGGFVFDDDNLVTRNALVKAPDGLARIWFTAEPVDYWPVTLSSLWVEWRLWGLNPAGYHLTNVLLHALDAMLLWTALRRLRIPGAFGGALLFALHPVNVQSVAWIAERKNVLSLLFFLLSIHAFLRSGEGKFNRWYLGSLGAFLLAMLSKGSVAILPLVLLGIVAWRRRLALRDLRWSAPFFAIAAVLTLVNISFQHHGVTAPIRTAGALERLLEAGATVWFYLGKALWPAGLTFVYPLWHIETANPLWWLPLLAALGVTALLASRPGWRPLRFAWLYFGAALIPVLGFADIYFMKYSLVADHYQYLALIGVTAAAAGYAARLAAPRWLVPAAAAVLFVLTWRQAAIYRDAETLYRATLVRNPGCWLADNNLGIVEAGSGRTAEARAHFVEALRLNPDYPEANFNLGLIELPRGGPAAAEPYFARAVRLSPRYAEARYYLANALRALDRGAEAIPQYAEAIRLRPNFPEAENNLGTTLAAAGRVGEALPHFAAAVRLDPGFAQAHLNLGFALRAEGRTEEALEQFTLAARLDPRLASPP
jgi:tetratricopeptide (TPR) repeat protein